MVLGAQSTCQEDGSETRLVSKYIMMEGFISWTECYTATICLCSNILWAITFYFCCWYLLRRSGCWQHKLQYHRRHCDDSNLIVTIVRCLVVLGERPIRFIWELLVTGLILNGRKVHEVILPGLLFLCRNVGHLSPSDPETTTLSKRRAPVVQWRDTTSQQIGGVIAPLRKRRNSIFFKKKRHFRIAMRWVSVSAFVTICFSDVRKKCQFQSADIA